MGALGSLHRALAPIERAAPRPPVATYAPPGSLQHWLPVTEAAIRDDPAARDIARLLRDLIRRLHAQWVPATRPPLHLVHGDARLSNICRAQDGEPVFLDFGFLARRPLIHDIAYALAFMVRALDGHHAPERFAWHSVPRLLECYEVAAPARLEPIATPHTTTRAHRVDRPIHG